MLREIIKMEVSQALKELSKIMRTTGISKEAAITIVKYLTTDKQMEEMIKYIKSWEDIITDHQAIQHAQKIAYQAQTKN